MTFSMNPKNGISFITSVTRLAIFYSFGILLLAEIGQLNKLSGVNQIVNI